MKKALISILLILAMMLSFVACGGNNDDNKGGNNSDNTNNTDGGNTDGGNTDGGNTDGDNTDGDNTDGGNTDGAVSEKELVPGAYEGSAAVSMGGASMTFAFVLTVSEDNTFTLTDANGASKGAGTWAVADGVYTLDFGGSKTTEFIVKSDDSLVVLTKLYYGSASLDPAAVEGGITLEPKAE